MAKSTKCRNATIKFKTKRGKVVSFQGRKGASCGPRKKPSTRHLTAYKTVFADAAKACARRYKGGGSKKAFGKCVGDAVRGVNRRRR